MRVSVSSKRIFGEHDKSRKTDGHKDRLMDRQQKKVIKRKGKGEEREVQNKEKEWKNER